MLVIETNLTIFSASNWMIDSGSCAHLSPSLQDLEDSRRLREGEMTLHIENRAKVATVAMGTYPLRLPSKNNLILRGHYFVPVASRNLISVSCLM